MSEDKSTVDVQRERRIMRAFQNPVVPALLRRLVDPQDIIESGMAFWSSRLVMTAVGKGVFTLLAHGPMSAGELAERLGWHPRAAATALDALVAAGLLRRDRAGRYANTLRASTFLDRHKSTYIGGLMELSSTRLYDLWGGLDDLLQTGVPAAVEEHDGNEFFDVLYRDPVALRRFLSGMTGISTGEVTLLAARFPWRRFATFADVGCAGCVAGAGRTDPPTPARHGLRPSRRRVKAREALPPGGALIVYDAMTMPGRSKNRFHSLLSSLNIMLETRDGYESTTSECAELLRVNGFRDVKVRHLIGPTSMGTASNADLATQTHWEPGVPACPRYPACQ